MFSIAEILSQIHQKERTKHERRSLSQIEGEQEMERERQRQQDIRMVIKCKVNEMRRTNIPEEIIRNVEKQLNLNWSIWDEFFVAIFSLATKF